ncbi:MULTISPECIES: TonB-dependent siderophore receptor [unclassified Duganella]|uniref:TonB-dependent receptor plug domain-containing protein n=1 Tax=unclassified Duganella TaxID=2636909 RepID=UPI001E34C496|nr:MULTISPECIES: TonB-dependent receptor [unclassified Duganella]
MLKALSAHRLYRTAALTLPLLAIHGTVHADPVSEEDELALVYGASDSVSIATGNLQTLRRAPAVATVITAADIAAMGATDLDQVLESVPGVHVNRTPNSNSPLYVVRGIVSAYTPQILMLQNGVPITTSYVGNKGNIWAGYPVEHIARIEIIRGPGSALYGSDAYSGVINIITKGPGEVLGTEVGARAGTFRSYDGWVQHGGKLGPVEVAAYLRVGQTDGNDRIVEADAQSRNDALFKTHASLAPGRLNNQYKAIDGNLDLIYGQWRARLGYKKRYDMGTGAGIASALDPLGRQQSERITGTLAWAEPQLTRDWGLGASLSSQQYSQEVSAIYQLLPPGLTFPTGTFPNGMLGAPETYERNYRLAGYADYSGWRDHHARIGAGHDDLELYRASESRNFNYAPNGTPIPLPAVIDVTNTTPFMRPQRRKVDYLYLQDEWNFATDWNLTAGIRHDHYSDFGGTTNPRLALVWDASFDLTAKLLYGRAFRAPAFLESYGISNPVALGNPNLKPERNATTEMSFNWQARTDATVNLTFYRYDMKDIIRTVVNPVPGTGATYANAGDQRGHGVELESNWNVTRDLHLSGNYAWQRSTDQTTHTDAGYAPRQHAYGRADWAYANGYQAGAQLNWVAGRERAFGDARPAIADYTTVDLTLATRNGRNQWNFALALRNAFNADVREPSPAPGLTLPHDLPMAPRTISLQASYKM